jgi:hypothetical protein
MSIVLQGSTSGSVTLQEPAVAGTTVLDLPATSGTLITTGSSGQSIPKAALPTGSVLQVVQGSYATETSSSSSTYADTGLSASITPTSSSSKILVFVSIGGIGKGAANTSIGLKLFRGATEISYFTSLVGYTNTATSNYSATASVNYLDSPATTSSTTYKVQFASQNNVSNVVINNAGYSAVTSYITLMEIAA